MQKVLDAFIKFLGTSRASATGVRYRKAVGKFLNWQASRGVPLERAPKSTLRDYAAYLVENKLSSSTVGTDFAAIFRFLRWYRTEVQLPDFHPVELPKIPIKVRGILSIEQLRTFFVAAQNLSEPSRTAVLLLVCSALRASEMATLPLKGSFKTVQTQLRDGTKKSTVMLRVQGKGDAERLVPILDEGVPVLSQYLHGWRVKHPDKLWLFPGRKNGHLTDRALRRALETLYSSVGAHFSPHTLRRTYLTMLYRKGVDPMALAKIAGHKNPRTLLQHYLYFDEQALANAVHTKDGGGSLLT